MPATFAQDLDAIAPWQEQQPSQHLHGGWSDVRMVVIEAETEVRVRQRRVELEGTLRCVFDFLGVVGSAEALERHEAKRVASALGRRMAGLLRQSVRPIESGVEDGFVRRREARCFRELGVDRRSS